MSYARQGSALTPCELQRIARALYGSALGDRWQSALARDLTAALGRNVSPASVSQWHQGQRPTPPWVVPILSRILLEAAEDLASRAAACGRLSVWLHATRIRHMDMDLADLANLPSPPDEDDAP